MPTTAIQERMAEAQNRPVALRNHARLPLRGLAALLVVYVVWGSTYLGIRVAVREGSGFPPFAMSGSRVLLAGLLLFGICLAMRKRVALSRQEVLSLAASAALLWVGGNGLLVWAEQHADSGYAALLVGSTPIWVALMEAALDRRAPGRLLVLSLLVGLSGVGVLAGPALLQAGGTGAATVLALLLASVTWGGGSLLQRRWPVEVAPQVSAAYQLLFGGAALAALSLLAGEPRPTPTVEAWLAWGYLAIVGSVVGFTAFVLALRLLPTGVAMTYSYVNPVVAVILGAALLGEPVTGWTLAGMALVLLGVAGVFQSRR